jgi:hypothetical protein
MWSAVVFDPARPSPQHPGQRLAGVVQEAEQRVVAEGLLPGRGRGLLLRVADHDGSIQIENQARDGQARRGGLRQAAVGLDSLGPGQFPRLRPSLTQPAQHRTVQIGWQALRGRVRGERSEQLRLVAQHRQVRDRFTAVGEHHRQVHRDPGRVVHTAPLPQAAESLTVRTGQPAEGRPAACPRRAARRRGATTVSRKATSVLLLWLVSAGSKFAVLELVDLVFGDAVSLGGFVSVTLLVITLLVARSVVRRLLANTPDHP